MVLQKPLHLILVLAGVHGAGGINQQPARPQQRRQGRQQVLLQNHQLVDHRPVEAPARIGMARQGAQTRTGSIEQDSVEPALPVGSQLGQVAGIGAQHLDRPQPQPLGVARQTAQPGFGPVDGPDRATITAHLGDLGGFAARGSTGIQNPLPGLGIQQRHHPLGGAVLHAPVTLAIAGQPPQLAAAAAEGQGLIQLGNRSAGHAGGSQVLLQLIAAGAQGVHPQIQLGCGVAGGRHALGLIRRQPGQQVLGQPARQRAAQSKAGGWVWRQLQPFPGIARLTMATGQLAQQPVDHWCQLGQAHCPGQLDAGVDRRGWRNPAAQQQLVGAQLQHPAQLGGLAGGWHLAQLIEPAIKQALLPDRAVGQLGQQGAIGPGDRTCPLQHPLEGTIGIGPPGNGLQHLPGQQPRPQASHLSHQQLDRSRAEPTDSAATAPDHPR